MVLDILVLFKAEEEDLAVSTSTDDNAGDTKINSSVWMNIGWSVH